MSTLQYGFETTLSDISYDDAVQRVTDELRKEGFDVITKIDIKATLKEKLDVDFGRYVILGACNPTLAHRALVADAQIGLLLPCNVVVQETAEGLIVVSIANPRRTFALLDNCDVTQVARRTSTRLGQVFDAMKSTPDHPQMATTPQELQ